LKYKNVGGNQSVMNRKTVNDSPVMIFAPYEAVFKDGPPTLDHFKRTVKSLSRTDTLLWCARVNLILADPNLDERAKQQQFLDIFFESQQIE
jgi:hypothetical protein